MADLLVLWKSDNNTLVRPSSRESYLRFPELAYTETNYHAFNPVYVSRTTISTAVKRGTVRLILSS